jgi:arginine/lysine/ornithine decarboxylase
MNVREAVFSNNENISVKDALGRVLSSASVSCPPAVPVAVCGEIIDENTMRAFSYYGIDSIKVVKK